MIRLKINVMKEKLYEILSTITKRKDDYGSGVSLRFKDGERTLGIFRYGKNGERYILTNAEVFDLMDVLNEKVTFKEEDLPTVDKVIKDYCLEFILS